MSKPVLILNDVEVLTKEQLEELIANLSEESKVALRLLFEQQEAN